MLAKSLSKRFYTTSRQIGNCIQISANGQLSLPVKPSNIVYKLDMNQSLE